MLKKLSVAVLASAALLSQGTIACDDHHEKKASKHANKEHSDTAHAHHSVLHAKSAYIRAMPPTAENTAAFMQMHNTSGKDLSLTDIHSPAAATVELHSSEEKDGIMRMRKLENWTLKKDQTASFAPGGMHIMFLGLKKPLVEGEMVKLRLCFADKACQQIDLPVRSVLNETTNAKHHH